jgi:hypothetical protein
MDPVRFDTLIKSLSTPGSRLGLVRLLTALPLGVTFTAIIGNALDATAEDDHHGSSHRRHRRKTRNRRESGDDKKNRKGERKGKHKGKGKGKDSGATACAAVGQTPNQGSLAGCCAGLSPDASGRCAAPPTPGCTGLKPTNTSPTQGLQEAIDDADEGAILTLCAGTWNLTTTVEILKDLTLVGAGTDLTFLDRGRPPSGSIFRKRVLVVGNAAEVTLENLTITGGNGEGFLETQGGGIFNNRGDLTLIGVSVTDSIAELGEGGGIYNFQGTLTLAAGSRVSGNTARFGAGIYNFNGSVTLQANSRVTGNILDSSPDHSGGGIFNDDFGLEEVTVETGAIICGNDEPQCAGAFSGAGSCPSSATCS